MYLQLLFLKRYWPRHINGDAIRAGAASLELGKCVAKCGLASKLFHSLWLGYMTATMWCLQCQLLVPSIQQVNMFHEVLHKASIVLSFLMITMYHDTVQMTTTMCDKVLEELEKCGTLKHGCIGYLHLLWGVFAANAWLTYRAFADSQEYKTHWEFRKALSLRAFAT